MFRHATVVSFDLENQRRIAIESLTEKLECDGRICPACGHCRDWYRTGRLYKKCPNSTCSYYDGNRDHDYVYGPLCSCKYSKKDL